jgi:hypothetical protein
MYVGCFCDGVFLSIAGGELFIGSVVFMCVCREKGALST